MKFLLLILTLIPTFVHAQAYLNLVGVTYTSQTELPALKNCIQFVAKVDLDRYLCRVYFDTIEAKYVIVYEKENNRDDKNTYTILDVAEFASLSLKEHLFVGSAEGKHDSTHRFVIAVDCCFVISKAEDWPDVSYKMNAAWATNKQTNKIEKLKAKRVMRVNEGFYWK